jgi:tellurite resistance protein
MTHGERNDLSTRIAQATGVDPEKVHEVVRLALEELHHITIVHEKGPTAAVMETCFSFGAEAAFHLIGLYISEHDYHGRDDDAGVWREVAMRFIPTACSEGSERIAPWFAEKTAARLKLDAAPRNRDSICDVEAHRLAEASISESRQVIDDEEVQFAREHGEHLQNCRPDEYKRLVQSGELNSYLSSVGQEAAEMYTTLLAQLNNDPSLRDLPFMERLSRLRSHPEIANEIVRHELVNPPPPSLSADIPLGSPSESSTPPEKLKPIREWEEDVLDAALESFANLHKKGVIPRKD